MTATEQRIYPRGAVNETVAARAAVSPASETAGRAPARDLPYESATAAGGETRVTAPANAERLGSPVQSSVAKKVLWREASEGLSRIAIQPDVMKGRPTINGTRVAVSQVLGALSEHGEIERVLEQFPGVLTREDMHDVLAFASRLVR